MLEGPALRPARTESEVGRLPGARSLQLSPLSPGEMSCEHRPASAAC